MTTVVENALHNDYKEKLGESMAGGFFGGLISINQTTFCLIVSPKESGEFYNQCLTQLGASDHVATFHNDGCHNTAMLAQYYPEIKSITQVTINDYNDWYIPSLDELEVLYRNLKPSTTSNACFFRSGVNLSAALSEDMQPYVEDNPAQTTLLAFKQHGEQAFDTQYYWTSSLNHRANALLFWTQNFQDGTQSYKPSSESYTVRLIRKIPYIN